MNKIYNEKYKSYLFYHWVSKFTVPYSLSNNSKKGMFQWVQVPHSLRFIPTSYTTTTGRKHTSVSQFWWIRVPFKSFFQVLLKIGLKHEYLNDIESNIFFHFQFQIMMLRNIEKNHKRFFLNIFFKCVKRLLQITIFGI